MKVAITTSSFAQFSDEPLQLLKARNIAYILNPHGRALTEDEALELLQGCIGVAAGTEPLTRRVMDALPDLKVISRCGTGMDSVDQQAAKEKNIAVRNTPDGPTLAVAELTLGYALDLMRQVTRMDHDIRAGVWKKRMGNLLDGKKVGIVGFGRIGRAVARLFAAFGTEIAFADPFADDPHYKKMELDDLLGWADIVTLHTPKPKDTPVLLDARRLNLMRQGAWIINAARGGLIDEDALHALLTSGHLAGAALDVFVTEPYTGPLKDCPSAILTPHIGSYAKEARIRMEVDTIKNLIEALEQ